MPNKVPWRADSVTSSDPPIIAEVAGRFRRGSAFHGVPGLEVAQWQSFCGGAEKVGNRSRTGSAHIPRYSIGSGKVP